MKRIFLLLIAVAALIMTAGCGQDNSSAAGFTQEDLYLDIEGTPYRLNMTIETVIANLGADYAYSEGRSCDYDGLDKKFIYEIAEFYTWPMPEGDLVNEIYTQSPAVSTSKGIAVGATKEDVLVGYGEECEDTGFELIYRLPDSDQTPARGSLCFDIEDGVVKAIYITAQPV